MFTNQMRTLTKLIFCCRTFRASDRPLRAHRIWGYDVGTRIRHFAVAFGGRWVWVDFLLYGKTPLICYMEANLAFILLRQPDSMFQDLVKLSVLCS